jgi:hypothetical protein
MFLSKNFSLHELIKSNTAQRLGIDNTPEDFAILNLEALCKFILQPCRDHFGIPFTPSSGYRSPVLCEALGSKPTSQHAMGMAADFEIPSITNLELAEYIRDNLVFDQLILEYYEPEFANSGWVHCSYVLNNNRMQVLRYDGADYKKGLIDA